ncbi:MAG: metallophosphoesterase [Oscillospiraceae bacterium]
MKKAKKKSKNKLLRVLTVFVVIIAALFAVWYYNTFTLKVTHTTIESEKIEDTVKIVQISDLHGATFGKDNITLIKKIEKQNPDFIVATGDMYSFHDEKGEKTAVKLLTSLAKNNKVYFVNGEHDYNFNGDDYTQALAEGGVEIMDYETAEISVGSTKLVLYGISNVTYSSTFDLANEFTVDKSKFNVLIAHIENFKKFSDFGIDLSICGDTHGGQVRLPFVGAVQNQGIWFPELSGVEEAAYTKGLYEKNGSYLFISSGLGNYPVPIRFMNRPEIAVIELKSK